MWKRFTAIVLFLLGLLVMLATVAPRIGSALSTGLIGGVPLAYQRLDQGTSIRSYDRMRKSPSIYVIADAAMIAAFDRNAIGSDPNSEDQMLRLIQSLHTIDYNQSFVVVVMRSITCGSCSMHIEHVARQGDRVRVGAVYTNPLPMQGSTTNVAEPYEVIEVMKEGAWGQNIGFELFVGGQIVANTSAFIP